MSKERRHENNPYKEHVIRDVGTLSPCHWVMEDDSTQTGEREQDWQGFWKPVTWAFLLGDDGGH